MIILVKLTADVPLITNSANVIATIQNWIATNLGRNLIRNIIYFLVLYNSFCAKRCPGVLGPCAAEYADFSAVYCVSGDCDTSTYLTRMEMDYNICQLGETFPDPFKTDSSIIYECVQNKKTGRMVIVKKTQGLTIGLFPWLIWNLKQEK